MFTLGWNDYLLAKPDKLEQGESLFQRMLEICRRTRGEEDELTLKAMNGLLPPFTAVETSATEALKLQQRVLEVRQKTGGPSDPQDPDGETQSGPCTHASGKVDGGGAATPRGRRDGGAGTSPTIPAHSTTRTVMSVCCSSSVGTPTPPAGPSG